MRSFVFLRNIPCLGCHTHQRKNDLVQMCCSAPPPNFQKSTSKPSEISDHLAHRAGNILSFSNSNSMAQRHYWGLYLDPKDAEKQHLKIFLGAPSEIVTPLTPEKSQGTKIFGSKYFSYQPLMILIL